MNLLDGIPIQSCVRCGYCCKKGPCAWWGEPDESQGADGRCVHLIECEDVADGVAIYACARYEEILKAEADVRYPMFGCGCSSTVCNTYREAVLVARNGSSHED